MFLGGNIRPFYHMGAFISLRGGNIRSLAVLVFEKIRQKLAPFFGPFATATMRSFAPPFPCDLSSHFLLPPPHLISQRNISQTLAFCCFFPKPSSLSLNSRGFLTFASPTKDHRDQRKDQELLSPSDPSEDDEEEDDDDEDDEEDDEAVAAAEEYDVALGAISEEDEDEDGEGGDEEFGDSRASSGSELKEEDTLERVERLIAQVRELGEDIIDFEELASIYDFPIDKFQVLSLDYHVLAQVSTNGVCLEMRAKLSNCLTEIQNEYVLSIGNINSNVDSELELTT